MTVTVLTLSLVAVLALGAVPVAGAGPLAPGQDPDRRKLFVDVHFEDRERTRLTVEATTYDFTIDLAKPSVTRFVNRCAGTTQDLLDRDFMLLAARSEGKDYVSTNPPHKGRLNIWRQGQYYYEVHVLDIGLRDASGAQLPVAGEMVFYCYPDKLHIEGKLTGGVVPAGGGVSAKHHKPTADSVSIEQAGLYLDGPGRALLTKATRPLPGRGAGVVADYPGQGTMTRLLMPCVSAPAAPEAALVPMAAAAPGVWKSGETRSAWLVALPRLADPAALDAALLAETKPLDGASIRVSKGGAFDGYDRVRGVYVLRTVQTPAPVGFEASWVNPNEHPTVEFSVRNDDLDRRIYVEQTSDTQGQVEAALVCDDRGWPLPIPVQTCKNFAGENEEPDDTPFCESYFPLRLQPKEKLSLKALHLFQNWGKHPLKQISSIRFFEHYWHMSTGVTETTCHVPFTKPAYKDQGYNVPDFRGMSGITWLGQPQHHHVALHGFLQYNDGRWNYLRCLSTTMDYVAPCFAQFTTRYITEDDKVAVTVVIFEAPQLDETRTFTRVRYDVLEPVEIAGDARKYLKLFSASTDITRNPYDTIAWTGPDGRTVTRRFAYDDGWPALGEPLSTDRPMTALYASDKSNDAYVVLGYAGRLGGKPVERLALSLAAYKNRVADHILTLPDEKVRLEKGDWFEADVILMPYGDDRSDWRAPDDERVRYGSAGPKVTVQRGTKIADFPTTVRAAGNAAEFTLTGGHDALPIIVRGLHDYRAPMLWEESGGVWQWVDPQVLGKDGYQVQDDPDGGYEFVFVIKQRNGMSHHYLVTQAWSEHGIISTTQTNHCPEITAARTGVMRLTGPRLYTGFTHTIAPGDPAITAVGSAKQAIAAPVHASSEGGTVTLDLVRCGADGVDMGLDGKGKLTLRMAGLRPGTAYRVTGTTHKGFTTDSQGQAAVEVDVAGPASVRIARAAAAGGAR